MKTLDTIAGKMYVVMSPNGGTVTSADGLISETVEAGKQKIIIGTGAQLQLDDAAGKIVATFNAAPALSSGGGVEIKFDTAPKSGSKNAVTSGGLYDALYSNWVKLGRSSTAGAYAVAIGDGAYTTTGAIALGKSAIASGGNAVVLGAYSKATKDYTSVLGATLVLQDEGCVLIGAWNKERTQVVQLYLISGDTPLANTYEDNVACLGYVVKDASGNIIECGTRKLSELLTNNTAFAPAALDLDADPPTPFLPTGIMEPIEFPDDLTE